MGLQSVLNGLKKTSVASFREGFGIAQTIDIDDNVKGDNPTVCRHHLDSIAAPVHVFNRFHS